MRELEVALSRIHSRTDFRLVHYSVQRDHAHLIVEAADRHALGRGMKSVTRRLAHAVRRVFGWRGGVVADRYHLRILKTPREVRSALRYVLLNARRHATGRRVAWHVDPASSGRWFDGWRTPIDARARALPPPVARAHTWLLRTGWRCHGLIDPADTPGTLGA